MERAMTSFRNFLKGEGLYYLRDIFVFYGFGGETIYHLCRGGFKIPFSAKGVMGTSIASVHFFDEDFYGVDGVIVLAFSEQSFEEIRVLGNRFKAKTEIPILTLLYSPNRSDLVTNAIINDKYRQIIKEGLLLKT